MQIIAGLVYSGTLLLGQQQVYEDVYRAAMEDSLITEDEANLLESLQLSLGLDEDEVLEIRRQVEGGSESDRQVYSRTGRRRIIAHNMSYGNGPYGWGIPHVLGVEDAAVWAGMQLLSFAGGLYLSLRYMAEMELPLGHGTPGRSPFACSAAAVEWTPTGTSTGFDAEFLAMAPAIPSGGTGS